MTEKLLEKKRVESSAAKALLRKQVLDELKSVTDETRRIVGAALARRLLALPEIQSRQGPLMLFLSMFDEVDTNFLVAEALAGGREVFVPRTDRRRRRLIPVQLRSLDDVTTGAYGIREPPSGARRCEPSDLAVVVVPAVLYDTEGYRLGRGGGYYDRFLPRLSSEAIACGVVMDQHLVERVPREAHDQPVHMVVTEGNVAYATDEASLPSPDRC